MCGHYFTNNWKKRNFGLDFNIIITEEQKFRNESLYNVYTVVFFFSSYIRGMVPDDRSCNPC